VLGRTHAPLTLLLTCCSVAGASEPSPPSPQEDAAQKATNPFALSNTLQVEPRYIDIASGGNATQLEVVLGVVYKSLFIPGVKVGDTYSFARLEMYGKSLNTPQSPNVVGLQDWQLLFLGVKPFAWGGLVGLGLDALLPTSTNPALDTQEFELGPSIAAMLTRVRHLQIGVLARFYFSVAGTTPDLAYTLVQPIITYHLPKAFFFKTDGIMNFDFKKAPYATVPVNLHLGHAFSDHLVISAIVEGVTTGSGVGDVTIKLNINYTKW
jgi:hypothetical protein